jgi:hypothetical protein
MGTVKLLTIADIATALGVTGQAVSAWRKNESMATPEADFVITQPHARRKFELLWLPEALPAWQAFSNDLIVANQDKIREDAEKAVARAEKAQAAAAAAAAKLAELQGLTAEVPSTDEVEELLNRADEDEVDEIDSTDDEVESDEDVEVDDDDLDLTEDEAHALGGTEDFPATMTG